VKTWSLKSDRAYGSGRDICQDAFDAMDADEQKFLRGVAEDIRHWLPLFPYAAVAVLKRAMLTGEEYQAMWSLLDSKERSAIKRAL